MEINQDALRFLGQAPHDFVRHPERIFERRQEGAAHQIDKGQLFSIRLDDRIPLPGRSGRIIRGPHHTRFIIDKIKDFFIVPGVVPHRQAVNAQLKKLLGNFGRDPPSGSGVFSICDNDIRVIF
ncbi:hypothetical protein D1872_244080 [compost metagenome]